MRTLERQSFHRGSFKHGFLLECGVPVNLEKRHRAVGNDGVPIVRMTSGLRLHAVESAAMGAVISDNTALAIYRLQNVVRD